MYILNESIIDNIPVLEFTPANQFEQPLPLVIFYHGWTNTKEDSATEAIELVKRGFRVVIPDCLMHGDRYIPDTSVPPALFFKVLLQNIKEYPGIIRYYTDKKLIKDDYITVAGLSMGGITTCMLLTHHPEIKAASILMGTPQLLAYSKQLADQYYESTMGTEEAANDETHLQFEKLAALLTQYDLSLMPEKIANRPLLFWHAQPDPTVPHYLTEEFYQENHQADYSNGLHFISDERGKHKVTYLAAFRQAVFLEAAYKQNNHDQLWVQTAEKVKSRFGKQASDIFTYTVY